MTSQDILNEIFTFHGHICWASAIGARAGIAARRELDVRRAKSSDELHCIVEIGDNHGAQCFADGVQVGTGCTFGKNNIQKAGWGKLALTLIDKLNDRAVRVAYYTGRHQQVAASTFMEKRAMGIPPDEIPETEAREMANILWEAPEAEVLTVGRVYTFEWGDNFGEIMGLIPCAKCGELVAKPYLRVVGDTHTCIPCSGYQK